MTYTCLVVDDNMIERDAVAMHLEKIAGLNIVAVCSSAQEAIQAASLQPVEIIFSDIQMPGMSGFELSKSFRTAPVFVYITSYTDYAAESFDVDAIDFVVKPATPERLQKAVNKAIEYIELKRSFGKSLDERSGSTPPESIISKTADVHDYFFVKETQGYTKLHYADVLYVESMGDFSKIHTAQNTTHLILISLKNFEEQLPAEMFRRVHKQYIINLLHIMTVNSHEITLHNKELIPISNSYREDIINNVVNKKVLHR